MNGPTLALTATLTPGGTGFRYSEFFFRIDSSSFYHELRVLSVSGSIATVRVSGPGSFEEDIAVDISGGELAVTVAYDEDKGVAASNRTQWTLTANGVSRSGWSNAALSNMLGEVMIRGSAPAGSGVTFGGAAVTGWQAVYLGPYPDPEQETWLLCPPVGANLVRGRDGREYVIRRDGATGHPHPRPLFTVYRRNSPAEAWTATATRPSSGTGSYPYWWPLLLQLDPWLFAYTGGRSARGGYVSDDGGDSWTWADDYFADLPDTDPRQTINDHRAENRLIFTAALVDPRDNGGAIVGYDFATNRERLVIQAVDQSEEVIADPAREPGQDGNRPCPLVWRRSDGTWVVGWLVNDDWTQVSSEYASLDTSLFGSWTQEAGEVVWGAGSGDMSAVVCHIGRDGSQVLAGYHGELQRFIVLARPNDTGIWSGPYLNVNEPLAAMPYVTQWGDGTWEVGWLIDGTWTRYTAGDPTGTWEVVS
ncbi:MAG: hypothetical protein HUU35_05200 [Armatimonadetes bacterium]|nr:hypothetical protein [Armatimonadota bacterium]